MPKNAKFMTQKIRQNEEFTHFGSFLVDFDYQL